MVKFIYSEKATKFCEISTLLLSYVVPVKSKVNISQNFVAFSEYMNFTIVNLGQESKDDKHTRHTAPGGGQKSFALFLSVLTIKPLNICSFKNSQTYGSSGFCHPT